MWRQAVPELVRVPSASLPTDGDWPAEAHDALQRGVESLQDRLDGVGIESGELHVDLVPSDQEVDVHAVLQVAERKVVRNRLDVDLARAIDHVLRELGRAVEDGAFDALPSLEHEGRPSPQPSPGMRVPWRMVSDSAHQYAQHCVTNAIRRGELTAGRVDPRDLAETALSEQLGEGAVHDLPEALRSLCAAIEAQLADEVAREADADVQLEAEDPDDDPAVIQDEPADTPRSQIADHLGAEVDLDGFIDHALARQRLAEALFSLPREDRQLLVEAATEGFPVDVLAAAEGRDEARLDADLRRIVGALAERLSLSVAEVVDAYTALGEELRDERIEVPRGAGLEPEEASAFE
ncbi:MAG: hypothetical protein R3F59_09540 [Myxococcota bacterium]